MQETKLLADFLSALRGRVSNTRQIEDDILCCGKAEQVVEAMQEGRRLVWVCASAYAGSHLVIALAIRKGVRHGYPMVFAENDEYVLVGDLTPYAHKKTPVDPAYDLKRWLG